jgi:hypothetical protein
MDGAVRSLRSQHRDRAKTMMETHDDNDRDRLGHDTGHRGTHVAGRLRRQPRPPGHRGAVAVARGRGHLRLRDAKAWTLLITMVEPKGFEEKKNERRIKGAEHGVARGARAGSSAARRSRHASAMKTNPMSSSSAEGKAASC